MTPTQRTLVALRGRGWTVGTVERWIPGAMIRRDLFGWVDLVALDPVGRQVWAIQSTGQDWAGHVAKIEGPAAALAALWLHCGGRGELWGWRRVKRKGLAVYAPRTGELRPDGRGGVRVVEWSGGAPGLVEMES